MTNCKLCGHLSSSGFGEREDRCTNPTCANYHAPSGARRRVTADDPLFTASVKLLEARTSLTNALRSIDLELGATAVVDAVRVAQIKLAEVSSEVTTQLARGRIK